MYNNGHYGQLNWTLWPQVYHETRCHFTCILQYNPMLQLRYMWLTPLPEHFTKETGPTVIGTLGKLRGDIFLKIAFTVGTVVQDCTRFVTQHTNVNEVRLARELANAVQLLLDRLESFTTTYRQMIMSCAVLQRLTLELVGLIEYCEKFKLVMQGLAHNQGLAKHLMGAFVTKVSDTELFYHAGIPFWFVHPVRNLLRIRVDEERIATVPSLHPDASSYMQGSSVIYEGPADIVAQHKVVMQHANMGPGLSFNVFQESTQPRSLPVSPVVASSSGPIRGRKKNGNAPCKSLQ